jgi:hypothetical protein
VLSPGLYAPFPFRRPILKVRVVSARDREIYDKERNIYYTQDEVAPSSRTVI